MNGAWWLPARAKLNLVLRVVGRRADGYHLLETLFHALELHDDLHLESADAGITLEVTADDPALQVPAGDDNLVRKALAALLARTGARRGFRAKLHKRIPHGGGLGGGSSDAAAALRLGNSLLGDPLSPVELHTLAVRLGADVPFFLRGGSQWARGIGDELTPAKVAPRHFVLVLPPFACPTAEVYKSFAATWKREEAGDTVSHIPVSDFSDSTSRAGHHNDLQDAAERVRPELRALRRRVAELVGGEVAMTGSGSTLFVPCDGAAAARRCVLALAPLGQEGVRTLSTRSADESRGDAPRPSDEGRGRGDRRHD